MADTIERYSNQKIFQGASGNWIEFSLKHSGGNNVAGATSANMLVSFVGPRDTTLQTLSNPTVREFSPLVASGHYLLQPTTAMIGEVGTVKVLASGFGHAIGQAGKVLSELTTIYVDVEPNELDESSPSPDEMNLYVTGLPQKLGYFVGGALTSGVALRV